MLEESCGGYLAPAAGAGIHSGIAQCWMWGACSSLGVVVPSWAWLSGGPTMRTQHKLVHDVVAHDSGSARAPLTDCCEGCTLMHISVPGRCLQLSWDLLRHMEPCQ